MDKNEFISTCNTKLKLIRTEFSFSQDKMAILLGISKKTLVEIEKGRSSLGWSGSVTLCTVFSASEILYSTFGDDPKDIILAIAFSGAEPEYTKTFGGKAWWHQIMTDGKYTIQQNIISQHYRIINSEGKRIASSLNLEDLTHFLNIEKSKEI